MSVKGSSSLAGPSSVMSDPFPRSMLSSSTTSSRHLSHISKTYRQASTLFLTRRLPEALSTLLPLINPPDSLDSRHGQEEPAPMVKASHTTRIKVWSLYLTILNAILELEPDEGKEAFGNQEWRALCQKVREGNIWDEVVRNGYHGVEGDVDADVVINLATLLLAHMRHQTLNQRRLETYLAMSSAPNLDLAGGKLSASPAPSSRTGHRYRSPAPGTSGANTPRDLNGRVKILELYTLHVLPRNNEWDSAREFINASPVLDDERRDAFLQALQSLRDEQLLQERLEREERQRQDEQLRKDIQDARRKKEDEKDEHEGKRVEQERMPRPTSEAGSSIEQSSTAVMNMMNNNSRRKPQHQSRPSVSRHNEKAVVPQTLTARAAIIMSRLRSMVEELATSLNGNPALLMRLLVFIMGLLFMLGHRGIRQRLQRILATSWGKIKATAGMGTKVSYI